MKKTIVTSLLLAAFSACSQSDNSGSPSASAASTTKVDGEKIYKTYCVTCHGLYGDMGGSGAFDLTKSILSEGERIAVITKGRNLMTPFEGLLSEEKIKAVAEYTLKLKK